MLKANNSISFVANKFNMSKSSVRSIYYKNVNFSEETIQCKICSKNLKQITNGHLNTHGLTLEKYKEKFPNEKLITEERAIKYKNFKNPNKGKTYEEIYGQEEGNKKREKISQAKIGSVANKTNSGGIYGIRRDTGNFSRSTKEANIDRIFMFENKKTESEFSELNEKYILDDNGDKIAYRPDRIDVDGLFYKGALLEIKSYINITDWKKITLFRKQYPSEKLLVIGTDKDYCDIDYNELKNKYMPLTPLWEDEIKNLKTRPDLYQIGYISSEQEKFLLDNYVNNINKNITDKHLIMICKKCLGYNKVTLGITTYIDSVLLKNITNKRKNASRRSTGVYNYELWEVTTIDKEIFYVSNIDKTVNYCTYKKDSDKFNKIIDFFDKNSDMSLKYGIKIDTEESLISKDLFENCSEHKKNILTDISKKLIRKGLTESLVTSVEIIKEQPSKLNSKNNFEEWKVITNNDDIYILSNFGNPTDIYSLSKVENYTDSF